MQPAISGFSTVPSYLPNSDFAHVLSHPSPWTPHVLFLSQPSSRHSFPFLHSFSLSLQPSLITLAAIWQPSPRGSPTLTQMTSSVVPKASCFPFSLSPKNVSPFSTSFVPPPEADQHCACLLDSLENRMLRFSVSDIGASTVFFMFLTSSDRSLYLTSA